VLRPTALDARDEALDLEALLPLEELHLLRGVLLGRRLHRRGLLAQALVHLVRVRVRVKVKVRARVRP